MKVIHVYISIIIAILSTPTRAAYSEYMRKKKAKEMKELGKSIASGIREEEEQASKGKAHLDISRSSSNAPIYFFVIAFILFPAAIISLIVYLFVKVTRLASDLDELEKTKFLGASPLLDKQRD